MSDADRPQSMDVDLELSQSSSAPPSPTKQADLSALTPEECKDAYNERQLFGTPESMGRNDALRLRQLVRQAQSADYKGSPPSTKKAKRSVSATNEDVCKTFLPFRFEESLARYDIDDDALSKLAQHHQRLVEKWQSDTGLDIPDSVLVAKDGPPVHVGLAGNSGTGKSYIACRLLNLYLPRDDATFKCHETLFNSSGRADEGCTQYCCRAEYLSPDEPSPFRIQIVKVGQSNGGPDEEQSYDTLEALVRGFTELTTSGKLSVDSYVIVRSPTFETLKSLNFTLLDTVGFHEREVSRIAQSKSMQECDVILFVKLREEATDVWRWASELNVMSNCSLLSKPRCFGMLYNSKAADMYNAFRSIKDPQDDGGQERRRRDTARQRDLDGFLRAAQHLPHLTMTTVTYHAHRLFAESWCNQDKLANFRTLQHVVQNARLFRFIHARLLLWQKLSERVQARRILLEFRLQRLDRRLRGLMDAFKADESADDVVDSDVILEQAGKGLKRLVESDSAAAADEGTAQFSGASDFVSDHDDDDDDFLLRVQEHLRENVAAALRLPPQEARRTFLNGIVTFCHHMLFYGAGQLVQQKVNDICRRMSNFQRRVLEDLADGDAKAALQVFIRERKEALEHIDVALVEATSPIEVDLMLRSLLKNFLSEIREIGVTRRRNTEEEIDAVTAAVTRLVIKILEPTSEVAKVAALIGRKVVDDVDAQLSGFDIFPRHFMEEIAAAIDSRRTQFKGDKNRVKSATTVASSLTALTHLYGSHFLHLGIRESVASCIEPFPRLQMWTPKQGRNKQLLKPEKPRTRRSDSDGPGEHDYTVEWKDSKAIRLRDSLGFAEGMHVETAIVDCSQQLIRYSQDPSQAPGNVSAADMEAFWPNFEPSGGVPGLLKRASGTGATRLKSSPGNKANLGTARPSAVKRDFKLAPVFVISRLRAFQIETYRLRRERGTKTGAEKPNLYAAELEKDDLLSQGKGTLWIAVDFDQWRAVHTNVLKPLWDSASPEVRANIHVLVVGKSPSSSAARVGFVSQQGQEGTGGDKAIDKKPAIATATASCDQPDDIVHDMDVKSHITNTGIKRQIVKLFAEQVCNYDHYFVLDDDLSHFREAVLSFWGVSRPCTLGRALLYAQHVFVRSCDQLKLPAAKALAEQLRNTQGHFDHDRFEGSRKFTRPVDQFCDRIKDVNERIHLTSAANTIASDARFLHELEQLGGLDDWHASFCRPLREALQRYRDDATERVSQVCLYNASQRLPRTVERALFAKSTYDVSSEQYQAVFFNSKLTRSACYVNPATMFDVLHHQTLNDHQQLQAKCAQAAKLLTKCRSELAEKGYRFVDRKLAQDLERNGYFGLRVIAFSFRHMAVRSLVRRAPDMREIDPSQTEVIVIDDEDDEVIIVEDDEV